MPQRKCWWLIRTGIHLPPNLMNTTMVIGPRSQCPSASRTQQLHFTRILSNQSPFLKECELFSLWCWNDQSPGVENLSPQSIPQGMQDQDIYDQILFKVENPKPKIWKQVYSQLMEERHVLSSSPLFPTNNILQLLWHPNFFLPQSLRPIHASVPYRKHLKWFFLIICACATGLLSTLPPPTPPPTSWLWKLLPAALGEEGFSSPTTSNFSQALPASMS